MLIRKSRSCPNCNASVPWTRLWLKSAVWIAWDCPECGARLGFSWPRRLAVGLTATPVLAVGLFSAFSGIWWLAALCAPVWVWIWTFDAVVCRQGPRCAEDRTAEPSPTA